MFGLAVLIGISGVLILDTLGSIAVRGNCQRYASLASISFVIYFATGNIAGRLSHPDAILGVGSGALAAALVGFADATVGWWISTRLGATPMLPGESWPRRIRRVSVRVSVFAAVVGGIGGAAAALVSASAGKLY